MNEKFYTSNEAPDNSLKHSKIFALQGREESEFSIDCKNNSDLSRTNHCEDKKNLIHESVSYNSPRVPNNLLPASIASKYRISRSQPVTSQLTCKSNLNWMNRV